MCSFADVFLGDDKYILGLQRPYTHVEIVSHFRKIVENGLGKWRKKGVFYPSDGEKN